LARLFYNLVYFKHCSLAIIDKYGVIEEYHIAVHFLLYNFINYWNSIKPCWGCHATLSR